MDNEVTRAEVLLKTYLDIPGDISPAELRGEATAVLKLAHQGFSRETIKLQIAETQVRRTGYFMDFAACGGLADEIIRLTRVPGVASYSTHR